MVKMEKTTLITFRVRLIQKLYLDQILVPETSSGEEREELVVI
jgi:hypothetical protein